MPYDRCVDSKAFHDTDHNVFFPDAASQGPWSFDPNTYEFKSMSYLLITPFFPPDRSRFGAPPSNCFILSRHTVTVPGLDGPTFAWDQSLNELEIVTTSTDDKQALPVVRTIWHFQYSLVHISYFVLPVWIETVLGQFQLMPRTFCGLYSLCRSQLSFFFPCPSFFLSSDNLLNRCSSRTLWSPFKPPFWTLLCLPTGAIFCSSPFFHDYTIRGTPFDVCRRKFTSCKFV
jgi:hypothetical protein